MNWKDETKQTLSGFQEKIRIALNKIKNQDDNLMNIIQKRIYNNKNQIVKMNSHDNQEFYYILNFIEGEYVNISESGFGKRDILSVKYIKSDYREFKVIHFN